MMNFIRTIFWFIVFTILAVTTVHAQGVRGNGDVIKKARDVASFTAINTSDGWDLQLTQDDHYAMTIEADENLIDLVQTEVRNGVLYIYSDTRIRQSEERTIHLTFSELNSITARDGSDIYAEDLISADDFTLDLDEGSDLDRLELSANTLTATFENGSDARIRFESIQTITLNADGGSDIELRNISGTSCELRLADGSDANLDGRTQELTIVATGGSDIEAYRFEVVDAILDLSNSSDAEMTITGSVDLKLSGGSDLEIRGKPQIKHSDLCKSCDLELR